MSGSRKASTRRFQPMAIPIGMPTRSAMPRPMAKWIRLACRSSKERPFLHQADKRRKDIGGRGEDERVPDDDGCNKLPECKRKHDREDSEPPVFAVLSVSLSHGIQLR